VNSLVFERWYPSSLGFILALVWFFLGLPPPENPRELLGTLVSLASIVVGFLATAMSIIVAAPEGPLIRQVRESGYVEDLARYLREPFLFGTALVVASVSGYFMTKEVLGSTYFMAALLWLAISLMFGLIRISLVFIKYLRADANLRRKAPPIQNIDSSV
jgi:hypothetical protein